MLDAQAWFACDWEVYQGGPPEWAEWLSFDPITQSADPVVDPWNDADRPPRSDGLPIGGMDG